MSQRGKRRKARTAEQRSALKFKSAQLHYLRVAPRKVRAVADIIRGLRVEAALAILDFTNRAAAAPLARMLRAAAANAASSEKIDVDTLVVKEIQVNQGPMLKRYLPRAQGRATQIQKKTSHVSMLLEEAKA
ncbi:MAG TPA: 50S ribosomal protein L22 [Myxococcota bacterium]|nr:50S ribosomal protein L22 [Myxococcota bacterium]HRY94432.1 50S ribosomal protein L22 [Myxococcota bacterium]